MAQKQQQAQTSFKTMEDYLNYFQAKLMEEIEKKMNAMPDGFNRDRFILNCVSLLREMVTDKKKKEKLQGISIESIVLCMIKGAFLGLDFMSGECYAIPYAGEMKFQTDYKGEVKVCKKHSIQQIKDIFAKVVREGDLYEEIVDGATQSILFKPKPFNNGKMIGAFAIVSFKDGSMLYESMSADEIEAVRNNYSKAKDSDAWIKSPGEMYKKTVIRRLSKYIEKDFDKIEQIYAYDEGGGVEFENATLSTSRKQPQALPDRGETRIPFVVNQAKKPEPVPAQATQQTTDEEFAMFEQQYASEQQSEPEPDPDYSIPDDIDSNLPFH